MSKRAMRSRLHQHEIFTPPMERVFNCEDMGFVFVLTKPNNTAN
ncbi:hypothetical protein [Anabaena sp. CCY 9910]